MIRFIKQLFELWVQRDVAVVVQLADREPQPVGGSICTTASTVKASSVAGSVDPPLRALRPGEVYFAVMGVHAASPMMAKCHAATSRRCACQRYTTSITWLVCSRRRIPCRSQPTVHTIHLGRWSAPRLLDWLDSYYNQKILFRFHRPV